MLISRPLSTSLLKKMFLIVLSEHRSGKEFAEKERDCRTIAIEVGMQNAGLASGLAKGMGKMATVGLAPAIFGPLMNVTGSILASYWHRKPPLEQPASIAEPILND